MSVDDGLTMQIHAGSRRGTNRALADALRPRHGRRHPPAAGLGARGGRAAEPGRHRTGPDHRRLHPGRKRLCPRAGAHGRPLARPAPGPALVVPRQPERHPPLSRPGGRDGRLLQSRGLQRRHPRADVDPGAPRHVAPRGGRRIWTRRSPPATSAWPTPSGWPAGSPSMPRGRRTGCEPTHRPPGPRGLPPRASGVAHRARQRRHRGRIGASTASRCGRATSATRWPPTAIAYALEIADADGRRIEMLDLIETVTVAPEDPAAVADLIARPETALVTLTVTEKAYPLRAGRHRRRRAPWPRRPRPCATATPATMPGHLLAGLARRDAPLTVMCCDNLPGNGAQAARDPAARWPRWRAAARDGRPPRLPRPPWSTASRRAPTPPCAPGCARPGAPSSRPRRDRSVQRMGDRGRLRRPRPRFRRRRRAGRRRRGPVRAAQAADAQRRAFDAGLCGAERGPHPRPRGRRRPRPARPRPRRDGRGRRDPARRRARRCPRLCRRPADAVRQPPSRPPAGPDRHGRLAQAADPHPRARWTRATADAPACARALREWEAWLDATFARGDTPDDPAADRLLRAARAGRRAHRGGLLA